MQALRPRRAERQQVRLRSFAAVKDRVQGRERTEAVCGERMTTSIFVRSYRADRFWLEYCLRSLQKFATGFVETIVALPVGDEPHFDQYDFRGAKVRWVQDPECAPYIAQQVSKVEADLYCAGENILFLDSDCFLTAPMRPEMFQRAGRPVQLIRHWDSLEDSNAKQWKQITESLIGFTPVFESMACLPLIYDRRTLDLMREHIQQTHKVSLREHVKTVAAMSEFNALGALAHRYHPHLYHFEIADPATDGYSRCVKQQWSYKAGGVDNHRDEYERILAQ